MDPSASKELVHSMLDATGSMQMLTDELDRLSLHSVPTTESDNQSSPSKPHKSYKDHDPHWLADWPTGLMYKADSAASEIDIGDNESSSYVGGSGRSRTRRISRSSSNYDSAIGSLQSRTDEETNSLQSSSASQHGGRTNTHKRSKKAARRSAKKIYTQSDKEWLYHTQQKQHNGVHASKHMQERYSPKEYDKGKQKSSRSRKRRTDNSTSTSTTSTPMIDHNRRLQQESLASVMHSSMSDFLRREGSTCSMSSIGSYSSNSSKRSSQVLSVGLSEEDIQEMSKLTTTETKSTGMKQSTTAVIHSDFIAPEKQHAEVVYVLEPESQDSDSSHSTIVGDGSNASTPIKQQQISPQAKKLSYVAPTDTSLSVIEGPLTPEIIVINEESTTKKEEKTEGTVFYQDSFDPQPSPRQMYHLSPHPKIPKRYRDSRDHNMRPGSNNTHPQASNVPKRSASFLQRLRIRRGTSFKSETKPKKRLPVRRSFSDRIMYQIRKGWVDYKEDLDFISNPSRLRPIGRMIDRQAGRLHIVQLHRPPNGRYGIFISESMQRGGVFVSRFADSNSAKFYSGLIEPGDEIVKINKEYVRDKSVDYVYNFMAKLDSVIFTVLPVNSRPDW